MSRFATVLALALVVGCGGSGSSSGGSAEPQPAAPSAGDKAAAEARLRERHLAGCGALCPRLTQCAVAEGRASADKLSPEERAALDDEAVLARNTEQCQNDCEATEPSPRQVAVIEKCVADESAPAADAQPSLEACTAFLACLDQAQPRP
jgi:hypothetical protein